MLTVVKITETQAASLRLSRTGALAPEDGKRLRKLIWNAVKFDHGIPAEERLKVQLDSTASDYLVVKRKETSDGIGEPASHTQYGSVALTTAMHFLSVQFPDARAVPVHAKHVGSGFFAHEGVLYFPLF